MDQPITISGGNLEYPIHMREGPGNDFPLVENLPQGTTATLIEDGGKWCRVSFGGISGYVMKVFVHEATKPPKQISVDRTDAETIYRTIRKMLGYSVTPENDQPA